MRTQVVRGLILGLCATLALGAASIQSQADEPAASLDAGAMDAAWRAAPPVVVSGEASFRVPEKSGTEAIWRKLPFALRDGAIIELCALRGVLNVRALLDDAWISLGPIGQNESAGPCILLSGQKVMIANPAAEAVPGRALPK
jgi:hypothetical protein